MVLCNFGDIYFCVEMCSKEYGWVIFEYDELWFEEIEVMVMKQGYCESWFSFDCQVECDVVGWLMFEWIDEFVCLLSLDVVVDVIQSGCGGVCGVGVVNLVKGVFEMMVCYCLKCLGVLVLVLCLMLLVKIELVCEGDKMYDFLCYLIGEELKLMLGFVYDNLVVVFFD